MVKITSAYFDARFLPSSDEPACTRTGLPCGQRGIRERAAHLVVTTFVIEEAQLRGIVESALLLVDTDCVVLKAIPQALHNLVNSSARRYRSA